MSHISLLVCSFLDSGVALGDLPTHPMGKRAAANSGQGGRKAAKLSFGPWVDKMIEAIQTICRIHQVLVGL